MSAPVMPFQGYLYPPTHEKGPTKNQQVLAVKIAISRASFWPWKEFDEVYNNLFAAGVKGKGKRYSGVHGFKVAKDLPIDANIYDKLTHEALRKTRVPPGNPHSGEWAFSSRARFLYLGGKPVSEDERIVSNIFKWWDALIAREPECHYSQDRPIGPVVRAEDPPRFPNWLDCSGTVIYTCWLADAKSPDPYGYSGYGNTNSLNDNGFRISISQVEEFCKNHLILAFYGTSVFNTHHVTAVKSPTQVYSMGREAGPEIRNRIQYRGDLVEIRAYEVT